MVFECTSKIVHQNGHFQARLVYDEAFEYFDAEERLRERGGWSEMERGRIRGGKNCFVREFSENFQIFLKFLGKIKNFQNFWKNWSEKGSYLEHHKIAF